MRTKDRYARLAGRFWRHPKAMAASSDALALWVRALSYVVDQMTDGHVTRAVAGALMRKPEKAAAELATLGLWEVHPTDGWVFHDYEDHNVTRKQWEDEAERNRKKTARHRSGSEPVTGNTPSEVTGNSQTQDARRKTQDVGGEPPPPSDDPETTLRDRVCRRWLVTYEAARRQSPARDDSAAREVVSWLVANSQGSGRPPADILEDALAAYWREPWPRDHANRASLRNFLGQADRLLALTAAPAAPEPISLEEHTARRKAEIAANNARRYGGSA